MGGGEEIEEKIKKKNTPEGAEKAPQRKERKEPLKKSGKIECMKKCNVGILEAKTREGKFYLSVVVDKESRYVLGHAFGKEMDKDLVARAVDSVEEEIEFEPGTSLGLFPEIEKYLHRNRQNTYDEAVEALERYIRYYNDSRIHPELGWTPQVVLLGKGKFKELEERSGNYSKEFLDWYTSLLGDDEDDKERSA